MNNPFSLECKTILVTGASSGIGKSTAIMCASLGARLILTGRDSGKLNATLREVASLNGYEALAICADLTQVDEIDRLVNMVGKVDGIVLCAGQTLVAPVNFTSIKKIESLMDVNFNSNVCLVQTMLKKKLISKGGSVVAVTSVLGIDGYMPGNSAYGASKAAFESWMNYCALEYAAKDIRFNTVRPGGIETPMANIGSLTDEQANADKAAYPMERYGKPEEVAAAITFFLSDAASFITGSSIIADGGRHLKF